MKERILWIPTLVILMTPVAIAIACMFLEVCSKTWGDLANGMEPTETDASPKFSRGVSHSL